MVDEEAPDSVGFGARCLVGYHGATGKYLVINAVEDTIVGETSFDLYEQAIQFSNDRRKELHELLVAEAPVGSRVFAADNVTTDIMQAVEKRRIHEVDEQVILDTFVTAGPKPAKTRFRYFMAAGVDVIMTAMAKTDTTEAFGVLMFMQSGQRGSKALLKALHRPKLAPTEEAAVMEAKIWLVSELDLILSMGDEQAT